MFPLFVAQRQTRVSDPVSWCLKQRGVQGGISIENEHPLCFSKERLGPQQGHPTQIRTQRWRFDDTVEVVTESRILRSHHCGSGSSALKIDKYQARVWGVTLPESFNAARNVFDISALLSRLILSGEQSWATYSSPNLFLVRAVALRYCFTRR